MKKETKRKVKRAVGVTSAVVSTAFVGMTVLAKLKKGQSVYDDDLKEKNPLEGKKVHFVESEEDKENADGVKGHLEAVGESNHQAGFYERYVKRGIDVVLSFGGLVVLSPIMGVIALAIKVEDPGPVLFTQKRMGQNKKYFKLHKFRSMKMSTPHDVPTHMLDNPDQYITKVGKFLRAHSLDELPQIWDIFIGNMSVIGPRPGLWNQDILTAERDKYGANDVKPGLTGWAQINGRDELEIPDKAKLDGDYVSNMGPKMDVKVFLKSLHVFGKDESVVEGGTGEMKKTASRHYTDGKTDEELIGHIGFGETVEVDKESKKRVLITGASSYIGESFEEYAKNNYSNIEIDSLDMLDPKWKEKDFSKYDAVFHVAGIAHADVGNVDESTKEKYYAVNTDLTVEVCKKAKVEGVKEFIFMSSMIVYGESAPYGKSKIIDENTVPTPANFYGDSKLQADVAVRDLATDDFEVIVLRPPMIYGKGSKGNYPILAKLAKKLPVFPKVDNERSMLHIDNLCEFLCQIILVKEFKENAIVLIPQNDEWTNTSKMVEEISRVSGNNIKLIGGPMKLAVLLGGKVPGKIGDLVNKAFGNSCYEKSLSRYDGVDYHTVDLKQSIERTENQETLQKKALILASVASMIDQFNMENINLLLNKGYKVDVICNCKDGNTITSERVGQLIMNLNHLGVNIIHVPIPRKITEIKKIFYSYKTVKKYCDSNKYQIVHCHSPIGGVIARLSAKKLRKQGTKVIYTAHGFHFFKGAPLKNWLIFYPVEKICSKITDVIITINKEDYEFAKKHMNTASIKYIPGVGIDVDHFSLKNFDKNEYKKKLNVEMDDILLFSVGELNQNKNHEIIIKALAKINNNHLHYFIAGQGEKKEYLLDLAKNLGVNVHLLGYRSDITELLNTVDIFLLPSFREGLSVALMEAMAAGLPCIVSDIRGNRDLVKKDKGGYLCNPNFEIQFADSINKLLIDSEKCEQFKTYNKSLIKKYDKSVVLSIMKNIYFS